MSTLISNTLFVLGLLVLTGSANAQDRPTPPQSSSRTFYDPRGHQRHGDDQ